MAKTAEEKREYLKAWRAANPDYQRRWRDAHPQYGKGWRIDNIDKERERERRTQRNYRQSEHGRPRINHKTAMRRAAILQATPKWLSLEQIEEIKRIYETCPEGHEVDHDVPLKSKLVCGLHVPWNLKHLEKAANRAKSNHIV